MMVPRVWTCMRVDSVSYEGWILMRVDKYIRVDTSEG